MRYEQAVLDAGGVARGVHADLGLEPAVLSELCDQYGRPFRGNSSFSNDAGIDSIDRWRTVLDSRAVRLIESLCLPEMLALGYEPVSRGLTAEDWANVAEPFDVSPADFPAAPSGDTAEIERERLRRRLLIAPPENAEWDRQRWFIFDSTADVLTRAVRRRSLPGNQQSVAPLSR